MAPLFVFAAFLTLTLSQSSVSNGTETTVTTNVTDAAVQSAPPTINIEVCPSVCTMEYKPVCDSHGVTHSNRCAFDIAACEARKKKENLSLVKQGPCTAAVGEIRLGPGFGRPGFGRPGPVMRERAPAICRTRYLYHPEKADWEGAKMLCEMEGGQLAVITSEADQGRIASRFGRLPEFWVGCTDIEREGQFRWVNGQGLGFARWYRSQPSKKYPNNEHCVTFNYWGKDSKWGDRNCYDSRPFLCETMVCKPARGRFPSGYPGAFKGPLRRPYEFPRNRNHPGPKGMGGQAVRNWPRGSGQPYNEWERIRTAIHN